MNLVKTCPFCGGVPELSKHVIAELAIAAKAKWKLKRLQKEVEK